MKGFLILVSLLCMAVIPCSAIVKVTAETEAALQKHTRVANVFGNETRKTSIPASELVKMTGKPSALITSSASEMAKAPGERVDVTLKLDYNPDEYSPLDFFFYSNEVAYGADIYEFSEDMVNVLIPGMRTGTYTFAIKFDEKITKKGITEWSNAFVILEDVDINESITITVDPSTTVNHFQGVSYLPGGEKAENDKIISNDGVQEKLEGNYQGGVIDAVIYDTYYSAFVGCLTVEVAEVDLKDYFGIEIDWDTATQADIYVNDISDRFLVYQVRNLCTENGYVSTLAFSEGIKNLILENDYSNYCEHSEIFGHTAQGGVTEEGSVCPIAIRADVVLGEMSYPLLSLFNVFWEVPSTVFYSTSKNIDSLPVEVKTNFQLTKMDRYPQTLYELQGSYFRFTGNGNEVVYLPSFNYMHPAVSGASPADDEGNLIWEGNAFYNHGLAFKEDGFFNYTYGNSAPIYPGRPIIYNAWGSINTSIGLDDLYSTYIGLAGEKRQLDVPLIALSVLHNGESVGEGEGWNDYWDNAPNEDPTGTYGFVLWNTENVKVDGIDGFNLTYCEFGYEWDDYCPPTLQAVQFRDADNNFAQTFDSAEGASILVAAGNYDWWYDEDSMTLCYNYNTTPVDVKVLYAPYFVWNDTNVEWKEIPVEELPEYSNQAGYGQVMKGSLEGITEEAYEGWFNLRIIVTNEQGYINRQTFGPAFRINNLASVGTTLLGDRALVIEAGKAYIIGEPESDFSVYSSDGKLCKSAHAAELTLTDLSSGIYIVKATSAGATFTKKIAL